MIDMGEHQNKDNQVRIISEHHKQEALRNMIGWKRKGWALYRTVGELLLSPKEGWRRMKRKFYVKVQHPEKRASSWEEGLSFYRRMSELLLSSKEGWRRMKWKLYAKVRRPEKRVSSWDEGWSYLPEGEWAVAESQEGWRREQEECLQDRRRK